MKTNDKPVRYDALPLNQSDLLPSPVQQFALWYEQARAQGEYDPSVMTLATVDKDYHISARILLLKQFSDDGFVFFTNYNSPKAKALESIPHATMVFWWSSCQRQVRVSGTVRQTSSAQSDAYFASRPRESQMAAIISKQSEVVSNRAAMLSEFDALQKSNTVISRPNNWGGYVLTPTLFEFWQGRPHRLHDRFQYRQQANACWMICQLYP